MIYEWINRDKVHFDSSVTFKIEKIVSAISTIYEHHPNLSFE